MTSFALKKPDKTEDLQQISLVRQISDEVVLQTSEIQVEQWRASDLLRENAGSGLSSCLSGFPILLTKAMLFMLVILPLLPVAVTDMYFDRSLGAHRAVQWWYFLDKGQVVRRFWTRRLLKMRCRTLALLVAYGAVYSLFGLCLGILWPISRKWAVWALRIFFFVSVLIVLIAVYSKARGKNMYCTCDYPSRAMRFDNSSNWIFVLASFYELCTLSSVVVRPESPVRDYWWLDQTIYSDRWQAMMVAQPMYTFVAAVVLAICWLILCTLLYFRLDVQNKQPQQLHLRFAPGVVGLLSGSLFLFTVVNLLRPLKPEPETWVGALPSMQQKALALIAVILLVMYTSCAVLYQAWLNAKTDDFFISALLDFRYPTLHLMEEQLIKLLLALATETLASQAQGHSSVLISTGFSLALCLIMLLRYRHNPCSVFFMNVFKLVSYGFIAWSALVSIVAIFVFGDGQKVQEDVWLPTAVLLGGWALMFLSGLAYFLWQRKRHSASAGRLYMWGLHNTGPGKDWNRAREVEQVFCTNDITPAQVALGKTPFVIVVSSEGAVYSYGRNDRGQLGHGDYTYRYYMSPLLVLWDKGILAKKVVCGSEHVLLLSEAGYVYSWGRADSGQLGLEHEKDMFGPRRVEGLPRPARAIIAGDYHSLVLAGGLATTPELYGFGLCTDGQLGTGYSYDRPPPPEQGLGTVWKLDEKQKSLKALVPMRVKDAERLGLAKGSAGMKHSLLLSRNGIVYVAGSNHRGQLGIPQEHAAFQMELATLSELPKNLLPARACVSEVAAGSRHSLLLLQDGFVYGTGDNTAGQIGLGRPSRHEHMYWKPERLSLCDIVQISAGAQHSGAVNSHNQVYTWGNGRDVQLGNGQSSIQWKPQMQAAFGEVKCVCLGDSLTAALSTDKQLYIAGTSSIYTGLGTVKPPEVTWTSPRELFLSFLLAASAPQTPLARRAAKTVAPLPAVTQNSERKHDGRFVELQETKMWAARGRFKQVAFPRPGRQRSVKQVSLGDCHGAIRLLNGEVLILGNHGDSKKKPADLQRKGTIERMKSVDLTEDKQEAKEERDATKDQGEGEGELAPLVPLQMPSPGQTVLKVSCGYDCTGLVLTDGSLWTWGRGVEGQLGVGEMGRVPDKDGMYQGLHLLAPERVTSGLDNGTQVLDITMGRYHTVVLAQPMGSSERLVLSCGSDGQAVYLMYQKQLPPAFGVLGLGDDARGKTSATLQRVEWQPARTGDQPKQVSAGLGHTLLLTTGGDVYSWGWGFFFALGHGRPHPTALETGRPSRCGCCCSPCSCNKRQVVASEEAESVNPQQNITSPLLVRMGRKVRMIDAGLIHSVAVTRDGQLFTWGMGGHGALGHGSGLDEASPRRVEKLAERPVKMASAGSYQTCALLRNGQLWITGSSLLGALGMGDIHTSQFVPRIMGAFLGRQNSGVECGNHQLLAW
eukprot:gb/GEZN01000312.1/.p1 GENE.gb/GEZN01000312.1/~~gb/GEZN01000312.1/.p1  ORF type:complete len:1435 (-),score=155.12 gb/GEZN01000312.1/:665-4969(-)